MVLTLIGAAIAAFVIHARFQNSTTTSVTRRHPGEIPPTLGVEMLPDPSAKNAGSGPQLSGMKATEARQRTAQEKEQLFGVGSVTLGLYPILNTDFGEVLRQESWSLPTALLPAPTPESRQSPSVTWTYPVSASGGHFRALVSRNVDGPYDSHVSVPDSVTILEREIVDSGVFIEAVSPSADVTGSEFVTRRGSATVSLLGKLEDWGTSVTDLTSYRVRGLERHELPLTLTVWVKHGPREKTQRLRFVPAIEQLRARRIPDSEGRPTNRVSLQAHIVHLPDLRRSEVEVLESNATLRPLSVQVNGEPLREPRSLPVTNARVELVAEYDLALETLRVRLWVETISGERYGVTWPSD